MVDNTYNVDPSLWNQMSDSDRYTWNTYYGPQVGGGGGGGARAKIDPRTLPDYNPGAFYDDYGNITGALGPYGGPTTGGPNVGYSAVGAPNSAASGVGYTGVTDSEGPGVASIGDFGDRGQGISDDASMYRGGDFQGGGSGDFAFGGGATENIQGSPVADLSQNPMSPMDPNATMYDGGPGGHFETSYSYDGSPSTQWVPNSGGGIGSDAGATGGRYEAYDWMNQPIATPDPTYSGGGIGSDAGATRDRIAEVLTGGGGPTMDVSPQQYPSTPFGGGFNFRAPTYNNAPEFNQSGTGWNIPPSLSGFPPTSPLYLENIPGGTEGMPFYPQQDPSSWMVPQGGG